MASEQAIANEATAQAVVKAMKAAIQTMAATTAERPQCMAGPKIARAPHERVKLQLGGR